MRKRRQLCSGSAHRPNGHNDMADRPESPVPYTFRRYVLPSVFVSVPVAILWAVRGGRLMAESLSSPSTTLAVMLFSLAVIYALSGVVTWFMGEFHLWRSARAKRLSESAPLS